MDHIATMLTANEINILYNHKLLGLDSSESFTNTLWLISNYNHFGLRLRGCQEHRKCVGETSNYSKKEDNRKKKWFKTAPMGVNKLF
mgnify:CR=1 FL=1